jgi:two-component system, NarL family, sensor histidine kinase BarA
MEFKPKIRILVVDDNETFSKIFTQLLKTSVENYQIEVIDTATNGKECIELLKSNSYELIFMDVEMPVMDGIETTKYITENYRGIKIFAISYHSELGKIQKILEAGARNYLVKEKVTPQIIKDLLKKYPFTIQ